MLSFLKEKSWSIKLRDGFVIGDKVRSDECRGCENTPVLVLVNNGDPDLVLYGCSGHKCRHSLIRVKISFELEEVATRINPSMISSEDLKTNPSPIILTDFFSELSA